VNARRDACLILVPCFVVGGCRQPTEIVIEVSTDVPCAELRSTDLWTGRLLTDLGSKGPVARTMACDSSGRIGSLVVLPFGEDSQPVAVQVATSFAPADPDQCARDGRGPGCIVARRSLNFLPHTKLLLPIAMRKSCEDKPCRVSQTCNRGACVPAAVDPADCASERGAIGS